MKIYAAEFRPKDLKILPIWWKIVLEVIGTGYYHSGMLIGNRYFEMYDNGYRELLFTNFENFNRTRGTETLSTINAGDVIDFVELPGEYSQEQIDQAIQWWTDKIKPGMFFGFARFFELAFWKIFRNISDCYHRKTGKILIFARTAAEKRVRVCSGAVDECMKSIGVDLFKDYDETITVPGLFAQNFPIVWRGH